MDKKTAMIDWLAQGRIVVGREHHACKITGLYPDAQQWRRFIDQMLLWIGVIALGASLIFFLAYNWQALGRYAKFALVEVALILSLLASWYWSSRSSSSMSSSAKVSKACLLLATLFLGALLALVGQTYQTGADTYELFLAWALACSAWVVLAQLGALYLFWLGLLNLAIALYFQTFGGIFGIFFDWNQQAWALFGGNIIALLVWEYVAWRGVSYLQERWTVRVLATYCGVLMSSLALDAIFSGSHAGLMKETSARLMTLICYCFWALTMLWAYRRHSKDLYMLAGSLLSLIVVGNAVLTRLFLHHSEAGGFLLIGTVIIASSAAAGIWLKKIAKEMQV